MSLVMTTAPAVEPVTLAEAKEHLRVDLSADDTLISSLIVAAREYVEKGGLNRALITQTWELKLDGFPANVITLPWAPTQSVSSITYLDTDGNSQTLATSIYDLHNVGSYNTGYIVEAYGQNFPSTRDVPESVTITFVAGYGDAASDVPGPIKIAILLLIGHLYENREAVNVGNMVSELPFAVNALLAPYRLIRFG